MFTDPALVSAYASLIGATAGVISALGMVWVGIATLGNRSIGRASLLASQANASAIKVVDVKVDQVTEQTNGHMTKLIDAALPNDPGLAASAAAKIEETAARVARELKAAQETTDAIIERGSRASP